MNLMWLSRFRAKKQQEKRITEIIITSRDLEKMYSELMAVERCLSIVNKEASSHDKMILENGLLSVRIVLNKLDTIIIKAS